MPTNKPRGKLLAVAPETVEPKKPKVLIYGPPNAGKTWGALHFPSVYCIDTEGGADLNHYRKLLQDRGGAYLGPDQGALDFDVVIDQIQILATQKHQFRTLVLDSASKLWNVALSDEQEMLGDKDAFGAYKKAPTRKFTSMVKWINRLDMTAIIICHQRDLWGLNEKKQREMIGYTFDCQDKLEYDLHLSLRIYKAGASHYAQIGKSRLVGFPSGEVFDWSYAEFASRYGKDVIEKEVKQIVLASSEQLEELNHLLSVVRVPDDWQGKVFKKENIEAWEEMDSDKIGKYINSLKERIVQ